MRVINICLAVLLLCLGMLLTGCTETGAVKEGTIEVFLTTIIAETDTPTEIEITGITAKISEMKIYHEKIDEEGEWVSLYVANKSLDLLQDYSQNQFLAYVDAADSSAYSRLSLVLEDLDVTLSDGLKLVIPSEPFEFTGNFAVFGDQTTSVVFTFKIDKSVVIEEDKISLKPIDEITWKIRYEQTEE